MKEDLWPRLEALYSIGVEVPPEERRAFLARECAGDEEMRRELESLLAANDCAAGFLEDFPNPAAVLEMAAEGEDACGRRIGPFLLTEKLGEGGMGTVYKALRADDQFRKQVAIKILKRGMDSQSMLRRFRTERQILASLEHPNIARLLDGGVTAEGLPYFVMELVEGDPILKYAQEQNLSVGKRIELFIVVCSAVECAHQKLVVHRDLKPGNILVSAGGVPKLLDFGIAKLLDPETVDETVDLTLTGMRLMTPGYASPEQTRGEMITTCSDVYSLGVVLYELLTGRRPLQLETTDPGEVVRRICEEEPPKASAVAPMLIRKQLAGDLDTILLKSLAKEPHRRYGSASHLAEDLQRHLDGLPVTARPDTLGYRTVKFVRRHRAVVIAGALLVLVTLAGTLATMREASIARRERLRAERRFNDVRVLANSFLFEFDDAIKNLEGTTGARQLIVKRGLEYLNSLSKEGVNDPELRREMASAYEKVSDVQGGFRMANAGDYSGAMENAAKAASLREKLVAAEPGATAIRRELASSYRQLSDLLWLAQKPAEAVSMAGKQLATAEGAYRINPSDGENVRVLAGTYNDYGRAVSVIKGDQKGLSEYAGKAAVLLEPLVAKNPDDRRARYLLAFSYGYQANAFPDDSAQALVLCGKALEMSRALMLSEPNNINYSVATAGSFYDLGNRLLRRKDYAGALKQQWEALHIFERLAAGDQKNMQVRRHVANILREIGQVTYEREGPRAAAPLLEKSLTAFEALPPPPSLVVRWGIAKVQFLLGESYQKTGNETGANQLFAKSRQALRELSNAGVLPPTDEEFAARALRLMDGLPEKPLRP